MKRFNILLVFSALLLGFASCNEAEPFATAEAEDYPRILDPIFPDRQNGNLAEFNTHKRDANLQMALTVTPAAYTTVKWFIDGTEVHEGHSIDVNLPTGSYVLRMEATTMAGKSTYREGIVNVEPLDSDPYSEKKGIERVIAPGCPAVLIGRNLNSITGVVIGGRTIGAGSEDGEYLGYVVPEDLEEGEYRVELVDAEGNRFGANKVTVSTKPLIVDGFSRSTPGSEWVLSGINLETIKSFDISGTAITSFVRKSATEIVLTFPDLEEGEYSISALDADGYPAYFYYDGMEQSAAMVSVSGEKTLWEGHHYVSWEYEDGHPNKVFGFISKETMLAIPNGSTIRVYYSLNPEDNYHKIGLYSGWWTPMPGTIAEMEVFSDGVASFKMSDEARELISTQAGFLVCCHGFFVDRVTVQ